MRSILDRVAPATRLGVPSMLKKLLLIVCGLVVLGCIVLFVVPIDPIGRIAGTRLGGELAPNQTPDWSGHGRKRIAVQTNTRYGIPHAVTTTSWITDGEFYVPCARCAGKTWPRNVARDNHVRLKIDGVLYDRRAVRITDAEERARILGTVGREDTGGVALFRMDPR